MAHGISGPLALLSLAMRRGIVADGQAEAIKHITADTHTPTSPLTWQNSPSCS